MAYAAEAVHRINHILTWNKVEGGGAGTGTGVGDGDGDEDSHSVFDAPYLVRKCNCGDGWASRVGKEDETD